MFLKLVLLALAGTHVWAAAPKNDRDMHPRFPVPSRAEFVNPLEGTSNYWIENAQKTVSEKIRQELNLNVAKNVILFLGDGMSIPTVAAARVYNGGEESRLAFDKFPFTGLSKTYAVDRQVSDSANSATAYLCGVKANYGTIGVGPEVMNGDCQGMVDPNKHALSIAYYSQKKNKRTGLVTTARVTHASPSGVYAHTALRDWESDVDILRDRQDPKVCRDIATQLVYGETGKNLNVIFGGGRVKLLPRTAVDEEGNNGERVDGVNLINKWLNRTRNSEYVWNRQQLLNLDKDVSNVMGLFSSDHIDYNLDRNKTMVPSLAEMTKAAIEVLDKGDNGYFLFVEGARIDMAHHESKARIALDETVEFSKAIQTAVDLTDESDTLIVVTSDHAHAMSYSGYASRGHDILDFAGMATDGIVYKTLTYANGPGFVKEETNGKRHDHSKDAFSNAHYRSPSLAPLEAETHGGDDVGIFARGPYAHFFSGVIEENAIPHLMSYASCVGKGQTVCKRGSRPNRRH